MGARARGRGRSRALAVLASALCVALAAGVAAADDQGLHQARQDLRQTKADIRQRAARMRAISKDLDRIATSISRQQSLIGRTSEQVSHVDAHITVLERRAAVLAHQLAERNRAAYILGPGAPVLYLLTATSAEDAAARMSILSEMNRRDSVLADKVQNNSDQLDEARAELARLMRVRELALRRMDEAQQLLHRKLRQSRRLYAQLHQRKEDILAVISRYRPFAVCPVAGPVAIANNFGVWVHRSEKWGGDHIHQGNDMMAAYGTPIVAPFDGTAVVATNHVGGMAVKVLGKYGYVYNAHLSRFGTLGPVHTGDVIGYVGNTGDTNANHDHFEWHPGNGPAVDPNPFLLKVC